MFRILLGVLLLGAVPSIAGADGATLEFQVGHKSELELVQFSADGSRLTSVDSRGCIRIWDGESLRIVRALAGSPTYISSVSSLYDGELIVFGIRSGRVIVWDTASDEKILSFQAHQGKVTALATDDLARYIASGAENGEVRLWDVASGELVRKLGNHDRKVTCLAFSPDGSLLASGGVDRTVRVHDTATGQQRGEIGPLANPVLSLGFHPDSRRLAAGSEKELLVWEVDNGRQVQNQEIGSKVGSLRYSDDGRLLVHARHGWVCVRDADDGTVLHTFEATSWEFNSVDIEPNNGYVAAGGVDKVLRLWRLSDDKLVGKQDRHKAGTSSVNFAPEGDGIIFCATGKARKLDLRTGRVTEYLSEADKVAGLTFSPSGRYLAGTVGYERFKVWDAASGRTVLHLRQTPKYIHELAFSPDEKYLASVSFNNLSKDRAVKLWELSTGKLVRKFEGHTGSLNACSFSPDGRLLATSSADRTVRVWEVGSGRCLRTYGEHDAYVLCVRISPDGKVVASAGGDAMIRLWDITSGRTVRTLSGHEEDIEGLEFSPDGRYLASASEDKTVRLWETATGTCLHVGREHTDVAASVAFSADGKSFVSGGWDGLVCIRSVPSGQVVASAMVLDEEHIVVFAPSGEYTGPAGVEQLLSVERDNRLLTAREIDASLHRDRDVVAALSQIRPSQSTAVHRTPEKRQREADSPPEEPSSLSARDIKPLFGTWVHPFGLRVPELWAKEVWNEDGTGAIYDAVDHTVPMDRFTFEVKKKHPDQPIYHVVIRYNSTLAFYVMIRTSSDGKYKESECYGPNVPHFPASFNPGQATYSVLYRQAAAAPSNASLVGTWVDPRGAFSRGMLGKIVFRKDNSGTIFDLVTDLVPADVFKYEVVWKDPRSPSYLVIVTYRPDNFWYLFVKLGKQGRLLETDSFGQCRMMYPPGINQRSRFWFSGEKQ